jgi:hypothetical protein
MIEFSRQQYPAIMAMPSTRRHRFVMKKLEAEQQKAKQMEAQSNRMKGRRR